MDHDPADYAWLEAVAGMEEDAVTVSLGPMGCLFQQLRSAISWQYRRLKGVKAEIQILGEGLEGLCTDLRDLSEAEDTITRCWVRQVRDLCYDTSDYLDELKHFIHYSSGTPCRKENRLGSKIVRVSRRQKMKKKLKRVHLIAQLSALVARVEDADERHRRFKISPPQAGKQGDAQAAGVSHLMPQLPLQLHVDNLIKLLGFDHDHNERNLEVAIIFGSAGVGKTAVARTLYHKYREKFQHRAFLRVSRHPDMRRLLADLLSQIKAPPAHAFSAVELLIATITKHLQGKSYLIVIDDLWDTSTWDIISRALPAGDYCRIMTTTQIKDVALACCSDQLKHIYEIAPSNDDQSGISESGCTTCPSTEGMKKLLNIVYNNLPPHLKTCLLHLNMYPEGWTVKKDEVVKQWVAEGFIGSVEGQEAEETAGCYFDALVSTGMVQVVDINHNDEVLSCTLHHMVLDLIRQESMEENFVTIVNYFQTILGLPDKVRRLSVQLGGAKGANNISGNMRISQVRSLIFCGFFGSIPSLVEYGLLQVLILHIWSDQERIFDLTTIGELYRLRYLKIECSITVKLPSNIQRLQLLGTLQVDARLYAVPSDIVHLEKLLHLCLRSESVLPHGVGKMTCLRTLEFFDLGCNLEDNVRDLGELENLQNLQLTCSAVQPSERLEKNMQLFLGSVLKKLCMLQSVTMVPAEGSSYVNPLQDGAVASSMIISCDSSSSVFPPGAHLQRLELSRRCCIFFRFPKWLGELDKLRILKIAVGKLLQEDIGILNGLPALACLSLHVATASTEFFFFGKDGFSVLRYFKFTCTVAWLKFEADAMPKLEKLKLCFSGPIVEGQGITKIIIERMLGLKEIYVVIGCVGGYAEYDRQKAIKNDPENPKVQFLGSSYYGDQGRGIERREGSEDDEKKEADIRVHMQPESWHLPVSEIISSPSESKRTDAHTRQTMMHRGGLSQGVGEAHEGSGSLGTQGEPLGGARGALSVAESPEETVAFGSVGLGTIPPFTQGLHGESSRPMETLENILASRKGSNVDNATGAPKLIPIHLLKEITDGFSMNRKLGHGTYGDVYLGEHKDGEKIAVKVLKGFLETRDEQFEKECHNLASLDHKNIVRLVGYCHGTSHECIRYNGRMIFAEKTKRVLCFEYMHNGSLDRFISDESNGYNWCTHYAIIKGICDGLEYLHDKLEPPMYHLYLNPSNVLLDEHMSPKIAGFSLSRLFEGEKTQITKYDMGTCGYSPPEYIFRGIISKMVDVYSLGVLIIIIMTGRDGHFRSTEMSSQEFIDLVHMNWMNRLQEKEEHVYSQQVRRCIEIALCCVQADRHKRPNIGAIVNYLKETESVI